MRAEPPGAPGTYRAPGRCRRVAKAVAELTRPLVLVLAVVCAAGVTALPASAGTVAGQLGGAGRPSGAGAGCAVVHLGPYVAPGAPAEAYLKLRPARGSVIEEGVVLSNPEPYPCRVLLLPAYGATAVNGGDIYVPVPGGPCHGASCLLRGLPATVTLPPGSRVVSHFEVAVPRQSPGGQYLAGVIGESAAPPGRPSLAQGRGAVIVIVPRVAIGVAITVPGRLAPGLAITGVHMVGNTSPPALAVAVRNDGNTWIHPHGTLSIAVGNASGSVRFRMGTVLPGNSAQTPLQVGSLEPGPHPVRVEIPYGSGSVATWSGTIDFPSISRAPLPRAGVVRTIVTRPSVPTWLVAVVAVLVALVAALGVALVMLMLRRRRAFRRAGASPPAAPGRAAAAPSWTGPPRHSRQGRARAAPSPQE